MPTTICFINQKGGCGKSSSCFHLGGHYAKAGRSVLLVDADPQGSLSQGFFGSAAIEGLPAGESLAAIFDDATALAPSSSRPPSPASPSSGRTPPSAGTTAPSRRRSA